MDKQQEKQIKVFGFGLPLLLSFLAWRHGSHHQWDVLSFVLFAAAAGMLAITLGYRPGLEFIFKYWMKGAHAIGLVVTTVILTLIYYIIFAPVALFLRFRGKDYMQRCLEAGIGSYWMKREKSQTDDKQQF